MNHSENARMKWRYAVLSIAFVSLNRPVQYWFPEHYTIWIVSIVFFMLASVLTSFRVFSCWRQWLWMLAFIVLYGAFIAGVGAIHALSMAMIPSDAPVNAAGTGAWLSCKRSLGATVGYLMFPLMVIVQLMFREIIPTRFILQCIVLCMSISLGVLLYQAWWSPDFLPDRIWGRRYGGLATDANAWALSGILVLPMLTVGLLEGRNNFLKFLYLIAFLGICLGEWWTGSRTAYGVIMLFIGLLPFVFAWVMRQWSARQRLVIGAMPLLFIISAINLWPLLKGKLQSMGGAGNRLVESWNIFVQGGVSGLFFVIHEARGWLYDLALFLAKENGISGWGPFGFYREFSNAVYRHTGMVIPAFDSALNHYLIILVDFGFVGLLLNVFLLFLPLVLLFKRIRKIKDDHVRLKLAILLISAVLFLLAINTVPPDYFYDVLWLWSASLAWMVAEAKDEVLFFSFVLSDRKRGVLTIGILILLLGWVGTATTAFGANGYQARLFSSWWKGDGSGNCFPLERVDGHNVRWCAKKFAIRVPLASTTTSNRFESVVYVRIPRIKNGTSAIVNYRIAGEELGRMRIMDNKWHSLSIWLNLNEATTLYRPGRMLRYFPMSLEVLRMNIPDILHWNERGGGVEISFTQP
ncbi:MAG: hypothetical protein D6732_02940 [Methanobacteriota archaeon]|nr:MAG: hypothetical protein D6732_02940 [Euryarchaeota archaeon]